MFSVQLYFKYTKFLFNLLTYLIVYMKNTISLHHNCRKMPAHHNSVTTKWRKEVLIAAADSFILQPITCFRTLAIYKYCSNFWQATVVTKDDQTRFLANIHYYC